MSVEPIRYGIVGLGRAGWEIHIKELRNRADAKIVAVADPVAERREQAAKEFGCSTHPSITQMLKRDEVEVAVIATPSMMHGPESRKAFKAGKHVVVEKPMAMSVAEADSMIKAAGSAGKKLFVHQNYRFFPEFTHLLDVVKSGILGRIFHIRMNATGYARRNDWQTLSRNGGGVLNNTCPHFIDQILQFIGGTVTTVVGDLQQIASAGDVEDHVKAFMRADNGCTADLEISSVENVAMPLPKWIICGTCGTLTSDGKNSTIRWYDPAEAPPLVAMDGPAPDRRYGNEDKLPWQEKNVPAVGPSAGSFYDNVFAVVRRNEPMHITPESVREVIRVISLIRKGTKFPGKPVSQSKPPGEPVATSLPG